ncbi:hypothetical protein BC834DRAFT_470040 [Gloeopeniophorella convolvens]|nr:hypothetical protein BC834DRAFT_470040 [Gloeopeniophorella convolvens]
MVRILAAVEFVHTTPVPTIVEPHRDATADPDVLDAHSVETPPGPLGTISGAVFATPARAHGVHAFVLAISHPNRYCVSLNLSRRYSICTIVFSSWFGVKKYIYHDARAMPVERVFHLGNIAYRILT